MRKQGVSWVARAEREVLATLAAQSSRLGEALTALAAAVMIVPAQLAPHWTPMATSPAERGPLNSAYG